jgi:hypothetical protein
MRRRGEAWEMSLEERIFRVPEVDVGERVFLWHIERPKPSRRIDLRDEALAFDLVDRVACFVLELGRRLAHRFFLDVYGVTLEEIRTLGEGVAGRDVFPLIAAPA